MLIFDTQEILRRFFAVNGDILLKRVRCWHKCEASLKNIGSERQLAENKKTRAGCGPKAHVNAYLSVPRRNWHLTLARRLPGFIGPVPSATLDKLLF